MTETQRHPFSAVAETIRKQMGVFGLGVVGASDLKFCKGVGYGGLTFKARLHLAGQTKVRIMRVTISLTAMDTYDIDVSTPLNKFHSEEIQFASGVYADQLSDLMYRLDSEGVSK